MDLPTCSPRAGPTLRTCRYPERTDHDGPGDDLAKWKKEGSDPTKRPQRDLQLETLALALDGEILVQNHCYRADEMAQMIDLAKEFGYKKYKGTILYESFVRIHGLEGDDETDDEEEEEA